VENCIGPGKNTADSEWIIKTKYKKNTRPVWVTIWGGCGGRFQPDTLNPHPYRKTPDSVENYQTDLDNRMATVYQWRPAWQADFAARLDWCVKPFAQANHPPAVKIHNLSPVVKAGR
jgi:hypothetical protein